MGSTGFQCLYPSISTATCREFTIVLPCLVSGDSHSVKNRGLSLLSTKSFLVRETLAVLPVELRESVHSVFAGCDLPGRWFSLCQKTEAYLSSVLVNVSLLERHLLCSLVELRDFVHSVVARYDIFRAIDSRSVRRQRPVSPPLLERHLLYALELRESVPFSGCEISIVDLRSSLSVQGIWPLYGPFYPQYLSNVSLLD